MDYEQENILDQEEAMPLDEIEPEKAKKRQFTFWRCTDPTVMKRPLYAPMWLGH